MERETSISGQKFEKGWLTSSKYIPKGLLYVHIQLSKYSCSWYNNSLIFHSERIVCTLILFITLEMSFLFTANGKLMKRLQLF